MNLANKQKQVVQLEMHYPGPLTNTQQVRTLANLASFDTRYTYDYMRVFVEEEESDYYLKVGFNGSNVSHWTKISQSLTINMYNPTIPYLNGNVVALGGVIYKCISDTASGTLPNLTYWVALTGKPSSYRYLLSSVTSFILYSELPNPIITAIEGTFTNGIMDTDGLTKINNPVTVSVPSKRRNDLPDVNGQAYEITFWENGVPFQFTGAINLR